MIINSLYYFLEMERKIMLELDDIINSITKENMCNQLEKFVNNIEERYFKMDINENSLYTVDRFEGEFAVCEERDSKKIINIEKSKLPQNAKEGSILKYKDNKFIIDEESQQEIEQRIKQKMDNLWN